MRICIIIYIYRERERERETSATEKSRQDDRAGVTEATGCQSQSCVTPNLCHRCVLPVPEQYYEHLYFYVSLKSGLQTKQKKKKKKSMSSVLMSLVPEQRVRHVHENVLSYIRIKY